MDQVRVNGGSYYEHPGQGSQASTSYTVRPDTTAEYEDNC